MSPTCSLYLLSNGREGPEMKPIKEPPNRRTLLLLSTEESYAYSTEEGRFVLVRVHGVLERVLDGITISRRRFHRQTMEQLLEAVKAYARKELKM